MRLLKNHVILRLLNSYLVDSPQPANISYLWNFGSLLGICLILQILTGVFLAMHYQPHVDFAFSSVEHIMRDVNAGWALRYAHANTASFFFIFVYAHIARGLYYSSYREPRGLVWSIGVIILILMMATGFLGYVLPYGQMSLWGDIFCPTCYNKLWLTDLNYFAFFPTFFCFNSPVTISIRLRSSGNRIPALGAQGALGRINPPGPPLNLINSKSIKPSLNFKSWLSSSARRRNKILPFHSSKVRSLKRIGPHNYDILSIIFGSLLGDGFAERHGEGTRICFQQEGSHSSYLLWFHNYLSRLGYCSKIVPKLSSRLALHGKIRQILHFKTFTFSSLNWVEECFYKQDPVLNRRVKVLPSCIEEYLSPLALAIWIMDDGGKVSGGLKLSTNNFTKKEVLLLCHILKKKFGLKVTVLSAGVNRFNNLTDQIKKDQYILYISKTSMIKLVEIVGHFIHPSMKYKLNGYL